MVARILFVSLLLIVGSVSVAQTVNQTLSKLIQSDSSLKISSTLTVHRALKSRERACVEQRRNLIAPTFCFHAMISESEREILKRECRELARTAEIIPDIDPMTPPECAKALSERAADLRYAGKSVR